MSRRLCATILFGTLLVAIVSEPSTANVLENAPPPGNCYVQRPPNSLTSPFSSVFTLWTFPGVTSPGIYGWTQAQFDTFTTQIFDVSGSASPQIFKTTWDYFCHEDQDPSDQVLFSLVPGGQTFSSIRLNLYEKNDCVTGSCSSCNYWESAGYGGYDHGTNWLYIGVDVPGSGGVNVSGLAASRAAVEHELAHLCDFVNKGGFSSLPNTELLSTAAEYVAGRWSDVWKNPPPSNVLTDVPLMDGTTYNGDPNHRAPPYELYQFFNAYLFSKFSAGPGPTDDLVYKWIRHTEGTSPPHYVTSFLGLGKELMQAPFASLVPGSNEADKIANLYQRYAIARYVDNPSLAGGIYGFGPNVVAEDREMFRWRDYGYARARVVPPNFKLGSAMADGHSEIVPSLWRDLLDPSATDSRGMLQQENGIWYHTLTLKTTGSLYYTFVADSAYFATHANRRLSIRIKGEVPVPANQTFRISYVLYDSYGRPEVDYSPLLGQPVLSVVETVPVVLSGNTLDTSIDIENFGSLNKGVLLIVSMVQSQLTESFDDVKVMPLEIRYRFNNRKVTVPSPYSDITSAIGVAGQGDTVVVQGGGAAYGPFIMKPGVRVQSVAGFPNAVVTNNGTGAAVMFPLLSGSAGTILSGITVAPQGFSTGISLQNCGDRLGEVRNCLVQNGQCGILVGGGTPALISNTVVENASLSNIYIANVGVLATVDSCTVSGGTTGITLRGTEALVRRSTLIDQSQTGILVVQMTTGDTVCVEENFLQAGLSTNPLRAAVAVDSIPGAPVARSIIKANTIVGWGTGIDLRQAPGGSITRQNIVLDAGVYGIRADGNVNSMTIEHNDAFENGTVPALHNYFGCVGVVVGLPGVGNNLSVDPELCFYSDDYSVNVSSRCVPENNAPWGVWIGSKKVGCLYGTLSNSMSLSRQTHVPSGGLDLLADFEVAASKTLTIAEGLTVTVRPFTLPQFGVDNTVNEFIVKGSLAVNGISTAPVRFLSGVIPLTEGEWYGIDARKASSVSINYAEIRHAQYGVVLDTLFLTPSKSIQNSTFAENSLRDILVDREPGVGTAHSLLIKGNAIAVGSSGTGIEMRGELSGTTVEANSITGSTTSGSGILVGMFAGTSTPLITGNVISGFALSTGLTVPTGGGGNAVIRGNTFLDCKYGIQTNGGSQTIGPVLTGQSGNTFSGITTTALLTLGSGTTPLVRKNSISNCYNGVVAQTFSNPNLGTSSVSDKGENAIHSITNKCLWNRTTGGGAPTIEAVANWWGDCNPPACTSGLVNVAGWLCTNPLSMRWAVEVVPGSQAPRLAIQSIRPNPVNWGGPVVTFEMGQAAGRVECTIFDVSGRLIRSYPEAEFSIGLHEIAWDGRNTNGTQVGNGLYLVRLIGNGMKQTAKVVVAR